MGRNSRSRRIQEQKRKGPEQTPTGEKVSKDDEPVGGSLMAMRAGFKSVVGTEKSKTKASPMGTILSWAVFAALVIALLAFFMAR